MGLLLLFLLIALGVSFACSLWESVLLSITPSYVTRSEQEGSATGALLSEFKRDIDRPLSAILTLNTIAHTVGAIGVGAQAHALFGNHGVDLLGVSLSYEALIAAATTLGILVLSEIIPKTLGASYWEHFAPFTVRSLKLLILLLYPLVRMSEGITRYLKTEKSRPVFSRADFLAMTELGEREGRLAPDEAQVVRNLLRLRELRARDIMTPRTVVIAAREEDTVAHTLARKDITPVSRLPVYAKSIDTVDGVVHKDDVLAAAARGEHQRRIASLMRQALFVLDRMHLPTLMRQLITTRTQLAVVVDEYGVTQGVVTMEDIVETLLGLEIMDEADTVRDMQELARSRHAASATPPPEGG